jgi:hypothetical protein
MKSIYNYRKTARLNGSLQVTADSSGLNIMDQKATSITQNNVQAMMSKTFNVNILNNSAMVSSRQNPFARTTNQTSLNKTGASAFKRKNSTNYDLFNQT